jgi:hypothetical protein
MLLLFKLDSDNSIYDVSPRLFTVSELKEFDLTRLEEAPYQDAD